MSAILEANKIRLGRHSAGMLLTAAEFDAITKYDPHYRYELIHGVLVVSPMAAETQWGPNELLGHWLWFYQKFHADGGNLDETLPERYIMTHQRRLADRVIWAGLGRTPDPEKDLPTVAVEFVSAGRRSQIRDYEEKRREYLTAGIKEFWILDRFRRLLTVFRKKGAKEEKKEIKEGEVYRSPLLPGFELDVAALLAEADKWAKAKKKKPTRKR